jgi:serine/threonine protein kinase
MEHRVTHDQIAVKFLSPPRDEAFDFSVVERSFIRQIDILTSLDHPCIVAFRGFVLPTSDDGPKLATAFAFGGSLGSVLSSSSLPDWLNGDARFRIAFGIASGMEFVHKHEVIHRDLKPSKVLLSAEHLPLVADFSSSQLEDLSLTQTSGAGTPHYMTPEQYDSEYDNKVDVYSYGLLLYELYVGTPVFSRKMTIPHVFDASRSGNRPNIPYSVPQKIRSHIKECWSADPAPRPSVAEISKPLRQTPDSRRSAEFLEFLDYFQAF